MNIILKGSAGSRRQNGVLFPCFSESLFYVNNHSGATQVVETDNQFQLALNRLEQALGSRTRVIDHQLPQ